MKYQIILILGLTELEGKIFGDYKTAYAQCEKLNLLSSLNNFNIKYYIREL